ncbi:MAG: TA system VapC family ribonuclease toxin [Rhizomicrobium sp.]
MILVDVNLLVYAHFSSYAEHERSRAWLDAQFSNGIRIGLPWASLLAFLRLTTSRRIFPKPQSIGGAWSQVCSWLEHPSAWIPEPTERHGLVLGRLLTETPATGDLVGDAYLAALAIEHGLTLCSNDRDFLKFEGLRYENPLAS